MTDSQLVRCQNCKKQFHRPLTKCPYCKSPVEYRLDDRYKKQKSREQLNWLLAGLDYTRAHKQLRYSAAG